MTATGSSCARTSVYIGGYTLDEAGIRMWPLRTYTGRWPDLADLQVRRADGQHAHHLLLLEFSTRARPVKVRVGAGIANLRRLAQVFAWIRRAAPAVCDSRRRLFEDFISVVDGGKEDPVADAHPSEERRLARARMWWLALHPKRALRECLALMHERSRLEVDAALLAIDAHLALGNPRDAVDVFEVAYGRHREDPKLQVRGAALLLDLDDGRGVNLAEQVVSAQSDDAPLIGLHWAWHHFRSRRWGEASDVLERVERNVRPLPPEFAAEFARIREEIAACRANPARGLRQTIGRKGWAMLLQVGMPLLILALLAWPIATIGPLFYAEARKLARLDASGVRVEATNVRDFSRHDVRETSLSALEYAFAPDLATAEPWEAPELRALDRAALNAYIDRVSGGRLPGGWYRGSAILYGSTASEIETQGARQFVTFLREDPSVNTIGPITWTRIWLTWLAGGKGAFMAVVAGVLLVYLALLLARDVLQSRADRRRGNSL